MKTCLVDGYRLAFRDADSAIWARQGPEAHKRTAQYGILLSVIPDANEHSELAKKIDRGNSYIWWGVEKII